MKRLLTLGLAGFTLLMLFACCAGLFSSGDRTEEPGEPTEAVTGSKSGPNDSDAPAVNQAAPKEPVAPVAEAKQFEGDVTLTIEPAVVPVDRVMVRGNTNLPSGTKLMASIKENSPLGFGGDSKCAVKTDGRFEAGPFGPIGGLKPGRYTASVVMPIPRVQPESVRRVIGERGEHLQGPLVESDAVGVTVNAEKVFTVGGNNAGHAQRQRLASQVKVYEELYRETSKLCARLIAAQRKLNPGFDLGANADRTRLAKWGKFARQFSDDQQTLFRRFDILPLSPLKMSLGGAVGDLGTMFHEVAFDNRDDFLEFQQLYRERHVGRQERT